MTKKLLISGLVFVSLGFVLCAGSLIASGVLYRIDEDNGIEPTGNPVLVSLGIEGGFWIFIIGVLLLIASAAAAFINKRRNQVPSN